MATQVKLRTKPISKGKMSFYLDFYPPIPHPVTGKPTRREFLNMHIQEKPKTYEEKDHNRELKALAENIRAQRQLEIMRGNYGFLANETKTDEDFIAFFAKLTENKKRTTSKSKHP